jgi:hypothetical protein
MYIFNEGNFLYSRKEPLTLEVANDFHDNEIYIIASLDVIYEGPQRIVDKHKCRSWPINLPCPFDILPIIMFLDLLNLVT